MGQLVGDATQGAPLIEVQLYKNFHDIMFQGFGTGMNLDWWYGITVVHFP